MSERSADVHRAKGEGKLAIAFDIEGANALNDNLDLISMYYEMGVRHMNFAYNKNNKFAGGCLDTTDIPLSAIGRRAVEEMNRIGMVVDCSHTGYRSSMDIMELSSRPVIFSHSNARVVHDHGRNIRDDQIKACARTGGVVCLNGVGKFVGGNQTNAEAIVRHIDYVVNLVGPEHVGIGIDSVLDVSELTRAFELHPDAWPGYTAADRAAGTYAQPEEIPRITEVLLDRGYSAKDVRSILGENMLRVASAVWQ